MGTYESRIEVVVVFGHDVEARTIRSIARSILRGRFAVFGAAVSQPDSGSIYVTVTRSHSKAFLADLAENAAKEAVAMHVTDARVDLSQVTITTTRLDASVAAEAVLA